MGLVGRKYLTFVLTWLTWVKLGQIGLTKSNWVDLGWLKASQLSYFPLNHSMDLAPSVVQPILGRAGLGQKG